MNGPKLGEQQSRERSGNPRFGTGVTRLRAIGDRVSPRPIREPANVSPASLATARRMIRERFRRQNFFDAGLFADPAWDMLLDLLQAELSHLRVPVSSLCIAAAVPATTATADPRPAVAPSALPIGMPSIAHCATPATRVPAQATRVPV